MKQRFLILGVCLILAIAMCLVVSLPGSRQGNESQPTEPTGTTPSSTTEPTAPPPTEVRLHIADAEKLELYQQITQQYSQETGIKVTVLTGSLEEIMESDAPTIFTLTDSNSLAQWQDRLYDLTDTAVLSQLYSPSFALTADGVPVGLAMDVEGYGLVYNAALLAQVAYTRTDISDFTVLKTVVEHITGKANALGFRAFGSPDPDNLYFAALLSGISKDPQQLRSFWDLYIANDTASGAPLNSFLEGQTAFYVGGTGEYDQLAALGFNNLDILPLYTADGGSFQCICSRYWCVNVQSTPQEIAVSLDFLNWMVSASENGPAPVDSLGYLAPFSDATATENSFQRLLRKYIATEPVTLHWSLGSGMSQQDLAALNTALQTYATDPTDENWATVAELLTE